MVQSAEIGHANVTGTSDPSFKQKLKGLYIDAPEGSYGKSLLPVRTVSPNPWGFYDMVKPIGAGAYEMTSDKPVFSRKDEVDRSYPDRSDKNRAGTGTLGGVGSEFIKDGTWPGYFLAKFRVAVDATPEEIAAMEKAEKK